METLIKELGDKVKSRELTWEEAARKYSEKTNKKVGGEAFRGKYRYLIKKLPADKEEPKQQVTNKKINEEYERTYSDGLKEIQRKIFFTYEESKEPTDVLRKLGYSPDHWECLMCELGTWEVAIRDEEENRLCTTVRVKMKPIVRDIPVEVALEAASKILEMNIHPLNIPAPAYSKGLDPNKLLEKTAVELHLGKLSHKYDTGENYDYKIAQDRFKTIVESIVTTQLHEKADTLLVPIGSDFFNTDTTTNTTTFGTPQDNDLRWKKLFLEGLKMWTEALMTYHERFNHIDVIYKPGNHDKMASFYLFVALQQLFMNDPKINFINNYQPTQCYSWGKCAIFLNHGDKKGTGKRPSSNRLLRSITAEFPVEWGNSIHRELHLDHLHQEYMFDDEYGIILRRAPSPAGLYEWHYENRYLASPRYQYYIWDKEHGMEVIKNINFNKKKSLIKKRRY